MKNVDSEWIFANPQTGKPYWPDKIREDHLIPPGIAAGVGCVGGIRFGILNRACCGSTK